MSQTLDRFFNNSITQLSLAAVSKVLVFIFVSYAVRSYGTAVYGKYALVISIVTLFYVFSDLGLGTLIIKEIAKDKSKASELFYNKLFINLISSVIGWGLLLAIFYYVRRDEGVYFLLVLSGVTIIFQAISSTYCSVFAGFERLDYNAMVENSGSLLIYATSILCVYLQADMEVLIVIFVLGSLSKIIIASGVIRQVTTMVFSLRPEKWKQYIVEAFPLFTIVIFYRIYFSIDSTILWFIKGSEAVGRYNPSFRFLEMTQFLPILLMGSIFPIMSRLHAADPEKLQYIFHKTFKLFMIIALPLVFVSFVLSNDIIRLIYGKNYDAEIVLTFQIIIWTVIFIYGDQLMGNFYIAIDRQKIITPVVAVCAMFNITANIVLIPVYGIVGAAITSLFSEVLQFTIFMYIYKYRSGYIMEKKTVYLKIVLISFAVACGIYFFKDKMNIAVLMPTALGVYGFSIILSGAVDEGEIEIVTDFIKRRVS